MAPVPDALSDPVVLAVVTLAVAAVVVWQRTLKWPEYRRLHALKLRYAPLVDRHTSLFVLSRKGYRDDPEYLGTREASVRAVWRRLVDAGGSPHLLNSIKERPLPDGTRQLSAAHVVWNHSGEGEQTEAYLFDNGDGTTDVYCHAETWTLDPEGHLSDPQTDGDPKGVVRMALGMPLPEVGAED